MSSLTQVEATVDLPVVVEELALIVLVDWNCLELAVRLGARLEWLSPAGAELVAARGWQLPLSFTLVAQLSTGRSPVSQGQPELVAFLSALDSMAQRHLPQLTNHLRSIYPSPPRAWVKCFPLTFPKAASLDLVSTSLCRRCLVVVVAQFSAIFHPFWEPLGS